MGVSYSSYLVAGVRMSDVYEVTDEQVMVKKYDPDTGVPYEKAEHKRRHFLFGEEIREPDDLESFLTKATSLKLFSAGSPAYEGRRRRDHSLFFLGLALAEAEPGEAKEIDRASGALAQVAGKLAAAGCAVTPSLWLISYVSC